MKIAILCDTHCGIKNGSDIFLDYAERFYSEIFFPYLIKNKIKRILHLGDYFDHRKYVNYKALNRNRTMFLEKLEEYDIIMDIIPGNHDCFFRATNDLCSLTEILKYCPKNVNVHMEPTVLDYDGLKIGVIPWINVENYAASIEFIQICAAPIIGAHLELSGFEMMKGIPAASHGMDAELFSRFETVMSGHYHTKSAKGNIHYLGVAFEHTWSDCNDPKYFHILDSSTRKLKPIRNNICIFNRLVYDDTLYDNPVAEIANLDMSYIKGSFVKVIVASKKDPFAFDKYIDKIVQSSPFDYKIVENLREYNSENVEDDVIVMSNTTTLLNTYVDAVETDLDKDRIKSKLQELYIEAQNQDAL